MKFIIKLFPEITIKSQSVRLRFIKILTGNIRNVLKNYDETLAVVRHWDHIEVRAKDENQRPAIRDALTRIPGIHHILEVEDVPFTARYFRADAAAVARGAGRQNLLRASEASRQT